MTIDEFLTNVRRIQAADPRYRLGRDGSDGYCDCIGLVIGGAFVPVARAVLAPVAVAVLVGGRRDGALVSANIAGRIRVIGVDVRGE